MKLKKVIPYLYLIVLTAAVCLWYASGRKYTAAGILFYGIVAAVIYMLRPSAFLQNRLMANLKEDDFSSTALNMVPVVMTLVCVVMVAVLPMKMSPYWNGEIPAHRAQYENITEAFLKGQLYFEYQPDDILKSLDNPYDPNERALAGAGEYCDSSFYNDRYYMYFGVVPVFLIFMPFRLITGHPLAAYHATQLFAAGFILGIFLLFAFLSKRFFPRISIGIYLVLSSAISVLSIWTAIDTPAMYCTAQVSALMMMVWSLYFFMHAVFGNSLHRLETNGDDVIRGSRQTESVNRQIGFAFLGSLCGALAFGCRPPVAMANILVLPLIVVFMRKRKITLSLIIKLFLAALPYVLVAAALMWYNYARFDNPFEFGKAYQITVIDASKPPVFDLQRIKDGLLMYLFNREEMTEIFPYQGYGGTFVTFPVLYAALLIFYPRVYKGLKAERLRVFSVSLLVTAMIICCLNVYWSPTFYQRYRLDYQYLLGILAFLMLGFFVGTLKNSNGKLKNVIAFLICLVGLITLFECFVLWMIPGDANISYADPTLLEKIEAVLRLKN